MKFRQTKIQEEDCLATWTELKVRGKWIKGIILDKGGRVLPFPCELKKGETYIIEVEK